MFNTFTSCGKMWYKECHIFIHQRHELIIEASSLKTSNAQSKAKIPKAIINVVLKFFLTILKSCNPFQGTSLLYLSSYEQDNLSTTFGYGSNKSTTIN